MKPRVAPPCWLRFDLPIPTGSMQSKLTVIDFFAGAGGLSFGFARADFAVEVAVDTFTVAVESPRTTKLYERRQEEISLDGVERIAI